MVGEAKAEPMNATVVAKYDSLVGFLRSVWCWRPANIGLRARAGHDSLHLSVAVRG